MPKIPKSKGKKRVESIVKHVMGGKVKKKEGIRKSRIVKRSKIKNILETSKTTTSEQHLNSNNPVFKKRKKQKKNLNIGHSQDVIADPYNLKNKKSWVMNKKEKTSEIPLNKNEKQKGKNRITEPQNRQIQKDDGRIKNISMFAKEKQGDQIKQKIPQNLNVTNIFRAKSKKPLKPLRARMLEKLQAARFRYINEQIYSSDSKEAQELFLNDPDSFQAYHEGYQQQVKKWPLNPLDVIINSIQQLPKSYVVADFGCGEANLAKSIQHKVHSFDLVAQNEFVTACDMAHVPLKKGSVDVAVFCLSLMGTNLSDYFLEANRVLKEGGILKVAEIESRFEDINKFVEAVKKFRFKLTWKDLSHNLFYFMDFTKETNIKNKKKLPLINLNPCLYKKR